MGDLYLSAVAFMTQKSRYQAEDSTIMSLLAEKGLANRKSYSDSLGCNGTPLQFNTSDKEQ